MIKAVRVTILLLIGLLVADGILAGNYYRYRDASGNIAINDRIPPEFVAGGYEVLSQNGQVIEVVSPQVIRNEEDAQREGVLSEERKLQQQEDAMLVRSYSTLDELEAARERRLQLLGREIEIVADNIVKSQQLLDRARTKAANHQRSGNVVASALLENITSLTQQIREAEQMATVRREEYRVVSEKYQRYIERFKIIKGLDDKALTQEMSPE